MNCLRRKRGGQSLTGGAGIYPIAEALSHPDAAENYVDYMTLSLYVTLGVFLLIAARSSFYSLSDSATRGWRGTGFCEDSVLHRPTTATTSKPATRARHGSFEPVILVL